VNRNAILAFIVCGLNLGNAHKFDKERNRLV
jgi:hypothetical protein